MFIGETLRPTRVDIGGRAGGLVVSVLAFYSDDPSSNPTGVYIFSAKLYLKERK